MWEDPEQRQNKKIRRIARNSAFAAGAGAGLWFLNAIYPYEEDARHIAALFGKLAIVLIFYGVIVLATVLFKRNYTFKVNFLMTWLVLPALVLFLFSKSWM